MVAPEGAGPTPAEDAEQEELLSALRRGIDEALTAHQREVLVALAVNGVPIDVLAERLGSTRGALYTTLHDARQKLRATCSAAAWHPTGWRGPPDESSGPHAWRST